MKYTDRKKTPLKWHRTVSFVLEPLLVIGLAWILFCMINELFSLHIPYAWEIFTPVLKSVDSSLRINRLGFMFWPVTGTFFATIVLLILSVSVWIGFLRWKRSSVSLWLLYLLVRTVGMIGGVVYLVMQSDVLRVLQTLAVFDAMSRSLLHVTYALIIVICLWSLIFLILNFIYYRKRRLLFAADYVQPEETETSVSVATTADKPEEKTVEEQKEPVSESTDQTGENNVDKTQSEPLPEAKSEETAKNENSVSESSDQNTEENDVPDKTDSDHTESVTPDTPESDEKTEEGNTDNQDIPKPVSSEDHPEETGSRELPSRDPNQVFCPYCGAKLGKYDVVYCSHCGRKLS